jgi:anti-sigma factor RsiW
MNHRSVERQLSAFVDNELSESEANSVRTHVEGCALCQQRVQVLRTIRTSIREAATADLPETFVYSVQRAVRQQEQENVLWLVPERFARNIVVALFIVVFALVAISSYLTPQPVVGEDRYFSGEQSDSAAQAVIGTQRELSKDDVMIAALTR